MSKQVLNKKFFLLFYSILGWSLFTVMVYIINRGNHGNIPGFYITIFRMAVAILFSICLKHYYTLQQQKETQLPRLLLLVPLLCIPPSIVQTAINSIVHTIVDDYHPRQYELTYYMYGFLFWWALFIAWSLLYISVSNWVTYYDKELLYSETKRLAAETELNMLRSQINSHFLFNALNSVIAEADSSPDRVKKITQTLSNYLRFSLDKHRHKTFFKEEIQAVHNQLQIEKFRFEENFDYEIEIDPQADSALTPLPLIQPVVENAVKYGIQTSPSPLRVTIKAQVSDRKLCIQIANTGHWVDKPQIPTTRIGLANLRRRLDLFYPNNYVLDIHSSSQEHVSVNIEIPLEFANSIEDRFNLTPHSPH